MIASSDIHAARILIVDDQAANVALLEEVMQRDGYVSISSTTDPTTVCALHREHRYDLILLDLQMPRMDGFAVLEQLKSIDAEDYLPVLVITAQPDLKLRALQAGAKDFISKPFDLLEVRTRIRNLLEVRLLYRALRLQNQRLEQTVQERTAELRSSEARFRRLAELSSDWNWEQDAVGAFTHVSGPVLELLGIVGDGGGRWDATQRAELAAHIAARRPFLDLLCSRIDASGATQVFQVSGEPMFDPSGRYLGYRGVGMDVSARAVESDRTVIAAG